MKTDVGLPVSASFAENRLWLRRRHYWDLKHHPVYLCAFRAEPSSTRPACGTAGVCPRSCAKGTQGSTAPAPRSRSRRWDVPGRAGDNLTPTLGSSTARGVVHHAVLKALLPPFCFGEVTDCCVLPESTATAVELSTPCSLPEPEGGCTGQVLGQVLGQGAEPTASSSAAVPNRSRLERSLCLPEDALTSSLVCKRGFLQNFWEEQLATEELCGKNVCVCVCIPV